MNPQEPLVFFGRENEIREIVDHLQRESSRVVVHGPGGIGKSTLVVQIAASVSKEWGTPYWHVNRHGQRTKGQLLRWASQAIGIDSPENLESATDAFNAGPPRLLVLDGIEGVVEELRGLLESFHHYRQLRVIVTSQVVPKDGRDLFYPYKLGPLPTPDPGKPSSLSGLAESPSVALFCEHLRTQDLGRKFSLEDLKDIAQICRDLSGIPLVIRVVAANTESLSNARDHFKRRPNSGKRLADQTIIEESFAWSLSLLNEANGKAARLLEELAVFVGGFDRETVRVVCPAALEENDGQGELLDVLLRHSFVVAEDRATNPQDVIQEHLRRNYLSPRYRLLDPIRDFALHRLEQRGGDQALRARHALWYLALAETADPVFFMAPHLKWLPLLDAENRNLVAADEWFRSEDRPDLRLRLVAGLGMYWFLRGHSVRGRDVTRHVINEGLPPGARLSGWLLDTTSAEPELRDAISHLPPNRLSEPLVRAFRNLAMFALSSQGDRSDDEVVSLFEAADRFLRVAEASIQDRVICLNGLSAALYRANNFVGAVQRQQEAEQLLEKSETPERFRRTFAGIHMSNLAILASEASFLPEDQRSALFFSIREYLRSRGFGSLESFCSSARKLFDDAIDLDVALPAPWSLGTTFLRLARDAQNRNEPARQLGLGLQAVMLSQLSGDLTILREAMLHLAEATIALGRLEAGAALCGAADATRLRAGHHLLVSSRARFPQVHSLSDAADVQAAFAQGEKTAISSSPTELTQWVFEQTGTGQLQLNQLTDRERDAIAFLLRRNEEIQEEARAEDMYGRVSNAFEKTTAEYSRTSGQFGSKFTSRELDVIRELCKGMTDREIADALFISDRTTSDHVSRILKKLEVGNRTKAAVALRERGLCT